MIKRWGSLPRLHDIENGGESRLVQGLRIWMVGGHQAGEPSFRIAFRFRNRNRGCLLGYAPASPNALDTRDEPGFKFFHGNGYSGFNMRCRRPEPALDLLDKLLWAIIISVNHNQHATPGPAFPVRRSDSFLEFARPEQQSLRDTDQFPNLAPRIDLGSDSSDEYWNGLLFTVALDDTSDRRPLCRGAGSRLAFRHGWWFRASIRPG